jgi:hypothetical protein
MGDDRNKFKPAIMGYFTTKELLIFSVQTVFGQVKPTNKE